MSSLLIHFNCIEIRREIIFSKEELKFGAEFQYK